MGDGGELNLAAPVMAYHIEAAPPILPIQTGLNAQEEQNSSAIVRREDLTRVTQLFIDVIAASFPGAALALRHRCLRVRLPSLIMMRDRERRRLDAASGATRRHPSRLSSRVRPSGQCHRH